MAYTNPIPHLDDEETAKIVTIAFSFDKPVTKTEAATSIEDLIKKSGLNPKWIKFSGETTIKHVLPQPNTSLYNLAKEMFELYFDIEWYPFKNKNELYFDFMYKNGTSLQFVKETKIDYRKPDVQKDMISTLAHKFKENHISNETDKNKWFDIISDFMKYYK